MNQLQLLHEQGQSVWFDYIERDMLQNGQLKQLVGEGVAGVTSNPSIFQSAMTKGPAYATDLDALAKRGLDAKAIYESLAMADIQAAADILRPVYDANDGQDGFVSLEVAPDLAYDVDATIAEARRLHAAVDRPNLMIKVPATVEGLAAVRQLISDGINVNVTLIFSIDRYADVIEAYIKGLEDRTQAGQAIDHIASVASFFVSRVDANVDARLEKIAQDDPGKAQQAQALAGKIAVANAKLAYRLFEETFAGARWQALTDGGAQAQRPLWASTSTKNPTYPDLLYVEPLIGPHTVNTMPPKTLDALLDHGVVRRTIDSGVDEAGRDLAQLAALGVSLDEVTDELEKEGVQKFADAFTALLGAIEEKRQALVAAE
jgi:transaldolase